MHVYHVNLFFPDVTWECCNREGVHNHSRRADDCREHLTNSLYQHAQKVLELLWVLYWGRSPAHCRANRDHPVDRRGVVLLLLFSSRVRVHLRVLDFNGGPGGLLAFVSGELHFHIVVVVSC